MEYAIFDIETTQIEDNDISTVSKIHCLSVTQKRDSGLAEGFLSWSTTDYDEMREFFLTEKIIIGHNICRFDIPVVERILNIKVVASIVIDTLPISWYLFPNKKKHGLEEWGEELGIAKPIILDWNNLSPEDYIHRCSMDVKINQALFDLQINYLFELYGEQSLVIRIIGYLRFKMECAREMEEEKWKLDVVQCKINLEKLQAERIIKTEGLADAMPPNIHYKLVSRPKVMHKQNGEVSALGQKWLDFLVSHNLPDYHLTPVKVESSRERGNPGSVQQLKSWLFSLGWEPDVYKQVKDDDGSVRNVPQISKENEPELSESITDMIEDHPELAHLDRVFTLRHRIGILESFLENKDKNDFLKAQVAGLTNTLRFKHKTIVNLPTIPKPYWEEMRGCLVASDDKHILCGSDMSGLEDTTKRHWMYFYDTEYVKKIMDPSYDPHIDVAVNAELLTVQQGEDHKLYDRTKGEQGVSYKAIRGKAKKGNFGCVYGAGPAKLAWTMKIDIVIAKRFHRAYWTLNWSVKQVAEDCITKMVSTGQLWLFNPLSQFWYCLRNEKDKFSTLNQGSGVYCFDTWVRHQRKQGIKVCGQFHDETVSNLLKTQQEEHKTKLLNAIKWTNDELKLNLELRISIDFGHSYKDIH